MDINHFLAQAATVGLVLFIFYRRFRRLFGRQPLRPKRMMFRIVILSVLATLLLVPALFSWKLAVFLVLGSAVGVSLGVWGAKHTRFEKVDGALHYIPHTYAGMVVSALFIARIIYRFVTTSHSLFSTSTVDTTPGIGEFGQANGYLHPLTFLTFFMLAGYYVYYYSYVLYESKHLRPKDWEGAARRDEIK
ncbi:MAG TPA: hypothetical protein VKT74_04145 [Gammaproteobacteria bacterium]|nr:hypothetical protein [Gammaproteobacteria bacterium]